MQGQLEATTNVDDIKDIKLEINKEAHSITLSYAHIEYPFTFSGTLDMDDIEDQLNAYNNAIVKTYLNQDEEGVELILNCLDNVTVATCAEDRYTNTVSIEVVMCFVDGEMCYETTLTMPVFGYGNVVLHFGKLTIGVNVKMLYGYVVGLKKELSGKERVEAELRDEIEGLKVLLEDCSTGDSAGNEVEDDCVETKKCLRCGLEVESSEGPCRYHVVLCL